MSISQLFSPQAGGMDLTQGLLGGNLLSSVEDLLGLGNQNNGSNSCASPCQASAVGDGVSMQRPPQQGAHHHGYHHQGGGEQMHSF